MAVLVLLGVGVPVVLVVLLVLLARASKFPPKARYGKDVGRNTLVTIPWSHYTELARWALQRAGVSFDELGFSPPVHIPEVNKLRGPHHLVTSQVSAHAGTSPEERLKRARSSLPLVLTPNGGILHDSWEIAAAAKLGGGSIDPALRDRLDRELGPASRIVSYSFLGLPTKLYRGWQADGYQGPAHGALQQLWTLLIHKPSFKTIKKNLDITPESLGPAITTCEAVFEDVSARLAKSKGPYMGGHEPNLGDFAFAAVAKTLFNPDEFEPGPVEIDPSWRLTYDLDAVNPDLRNLVNKLRCTPAGRMAMNLYRKERRQIVPPNPPVADLWAPGAAASPDGRYTNHKLSAL